MANSIKAENNDEFFYSLDDPRSAMKNIDVMDKYSCKMIAKADKVYNNYINKACKINDVYVKSNHYKQEAEHKTFAWIEKYKWVVTQSLDKSKNVIDAYSDFMDYMQGLPIRRSLIEQYSCYAKLWVVFGKSTKEIANDLKLTETSIRRIRKNVDRLYNEYVSDRGGYN